MRKTTATLALLSLACLPQAASAEDWLQFRGANASGLTGETSLPANWAESQNVKWKADIPGQGWSAPVVTGGKVILTAAVPDGAESRDTVHTYEIFCFAEDSGDLLWREVALEATPRLGKHRDNTYASETPVTDGKHIVAYFGMMGVFCYDLDGKQVWKKDLGNYKMRNEWGTSSSPALHDGKVFVQIDSDQDSFLVALDLATGNEIWRKPRDERSNWGSAMIWTNSQRSELVTNGDIVRSYNPDNGDLLWEIDLGVGSVNSTPSATADAIIVGSGGRRGASMHAVRAGASGDLTPQGSTQNEGILWSNTSDGPQMSSPLVYQGYVYLLRRNGGQLTCLDAATGKQVYRGRLPDAGAFWASPWAYDGKIFCPDANGVTHVLAVGPELKVLDTNKLPKGEKTKYWASSAIANGTVYIRSTETLYAISGS